MPLKAGTNVCDLCNFFLNEERNVGEKLRYYEVDF